MGSSSKRPKRLGKYTIVGRLGSGGMSRVYRAIADNADTAVALKVTPLENDVDVEVADYQREVMIARRIQHPNVITAIDHGCAGGHIFLAMPILNGATLSNVTRLRDPSRKPSSRKSSAYNDEWAVPLLEGRWDQIAKLGLQMSDALAACHDAGVIHRDIKPGNIMLDRKGNGHLMDFGLAWLRRGQPGHELETKAGTARYLPPEVFDGRRDERSDIYSLGVTLHELATGLKLWGDVDHETVREERPSLMVPTVHEVRKDVPQMLADCIDKASADEPDQRHQTAHELRDHFQLIYDGLSTAALPDFKETVVSGGFWSQESEAPELSEHIWFS